MAKAKFPGLKQCLRMMRKHDLSIPEEGFHGLRPHANEFVESLIAEFQSETDRGLRCWLLELIGEAKDPRALVC